MDSSNLNDWLAWQESVNPEEIDLGLNRITELLQRLDLDLPKIVLTVGGTNGKGSTVALLESLLAAAGYSVGAYTSPHLLHYNERIRVLGQPVDDRVIVRAFRRIEAVRADVQLTFFEFGTLAALCVFAEARPDVVLLEVGLGGRLDAVNAVDPAGVIVTSIGLDHQSWLGNDLEAIATEKAGIMRAGRPAIFAGETAPKSIARTASRIGANLYCRGADYEFRERGQLWDWQAPDRRLDGLKKPGLEGVHQLSNAAAALMLLHTVGLLDRMHREQIDAGLAAAALAARFQRVGSEPEWIVDVAHNPAAATALESVLSRSRPEGHTFALAGMLTDKDRGATVRALSAAVDTWFAVDIDSDRAVSAETLAAEIANQTDSPCRYFPSLLPALDHLSKIAGPDDRVVIFGSFLLAGPVLAWLAEREENEFGPRVTPSLKEI